MRKNNKNDSQSFDKLKTIIISILMSIIAWIAIVNIVNPDVSKTFRSIPIRITGTSALRDKELVAVGLSTLPDCSVKIKGKRKDVINASRDIIAVANVSDISRQGTATVDISISLPSSVKLVKQELSSVDIAIEPRYKKNIPVTVTQTNVLKDKLIESVPERDVIEVTGSKSELDKISECNITINLENTTSDNSIMHPFTYISPEGEQVSELDTIFCKVTNILVTNTVYTKKTAKPKLMLPDDEEHGYRLKYNKDEILEKSINVGIKSNKEVPKELIYTISKEDIKEGTYTIYPECEDIEGIYIPKKQLSVSLTADKIVTKAVPVSITHTKPLEGLNVINFTDSKKFTLSGTEEELTNVKASADISNLGAGTHYVTLKFEDSDIESDTECVITVTLE